MEIYFSRAGHNNRFFRMVFCEVLQDGFYQKRILKKFQMFEGVVKFEQFSAMHLLKDKKMKK